MDPNQPGYPPQGPYPPSGAPGPGQPGAYGQPVSPQPTSPQPTSPQSTHPPEPKFAFSLGQILGAILFVVLIIFIVENSNDVPIRIIAGPIVHPPLWVAIVISAVLGALISELLRYRRRVGARRKAMVREHKSETG